MPFGRLHEEAAGDSKLLALSDAAWRMWGMGLIYCQKNLTDGFIPGHAIASFGVRGLDIDATLGGIDSTSWPKRVWEAVSAAIKALASTPRTVANELCTPQVPGKAALWERVDGGYRVHDYLQWNDSKDEILKMRADGKERVRRFRERAKEERGRLEQIAEQVMQQTPERYALPNEVQHAHDVVRGSGDLTEKEGVARFAHPHSGDGVLAGALPRNHLHHVACDPSFSLCVPAAVHAKLLNKLAPKHGGDRDAAGRALHDWYPTVWASLPAEFVMGDEFKFWQGRFDGAFASLDPASKSKPGEATKSTVPGADRTKEYLDRQRQV